MACRGVHFALTDEQASRVLGARNEGELLGVIEEIETAWDEEHLQETDKTWAAIHRVLTDGTTDRNAGPYPLNRCVLGGRQLCHGEHYIVSFVDKHEVRDLVPALEGVREDWLRERFVRLQALPNEDLVGEENWPYVWEYFQLLVGFYRRAVAENRPVIFTVDQ